MKFGSLFSGIGGLDLGLERAGMVCAWQVEADKWCREVLAHHWPDVERFEDVRDVGKHNLPPVRLICGGDPCQANSIAGRRNHVRSESLALEFLRIVDELRPTLVLRENPMVTRRDAPWPWWRFRNELEVLGYGVVTFRLRACCAGADHRRDRMFLLAELPDADPVRCDARGGQAGPEGKRRTEPSGSTGQEDRSGMGGAVYGLSRRVDRLQGLGNAVFPAVAEWIGRRIILVDGQ